MSTLKDELGLALKDIYGRGEGTSNEELSESWLQIRWGELNQLRRPFKLDIQHPLGRESNKTVCEVKLDAVVQGGEETRWGQVNNRPESYGRIVRGLMQDTSPGYEDWVRKMGHMDLIGYEAPYGPIFSVCSDGRHRLHSLKALRVSHFPSEVCFRRMIRPGDEMVMPIHGSSNLNEESRLDWLLILESNGVVKVTRYDTNLITYTLCSEAPLPWALETPKYVVALSRLYGEIYPAFRRDSIYETVTDLQSVRDMRHLNISYTASSPQSHRRSDGWMKRLIDTIRR